MLSLPAAGFVRRTAAWLAPVAAALAIGGAFGAAPAQAHPPHWRTVGGTRLASSATVVSDEAPKLPAKKVLTSKSWLVADADSGAVLAARNPHGAFLPASTLKTLTAVTLLPRLDPKRKITPSAADIDVDGSRVGLVPTMSYTVDQLFTCMLVVSGNDCADTLADAAGGTGKTLALMNANAQRLRAFDTHAGTPSGLDAPRESSSAYDLALIARAGLSMPAFRHYVGIVRDEFPAPHRKHYEIDNHNRLLTRYSGAIGVKNGYTVAAKATYVGAATRDGHTVIVTIMHARPNFWPEARALLDWGFAADGSPPVGHLVAPQRNGRTMHADRASVRSGRTARRSTPGPTARTPASTGRRSLRSTSSAGPSGLPLLVIGIGVVTSGLMVVGQRRRRRR
jgi:D-alanyl-D-alanine carboxypeptidase (penicillin-binding protein 5/6)